MKTNYVGGSDPTQMMMMICVYIPRRPEVLAKTWQALLLGKLSTGIYVLYRSDPELPSSLCVSSIYYLYLFACRILLLYSSKSGTSMYSRIQIIANVRDPILALARVFTR
jgi:hypothetical protein